MRKEDTKSNYKMDTISQYIIRIKRKLCTVSINGVHYEYVGDHNGENYNYAAHCPCDNESIRKLIRERVNRIIRKRSQLWH